MGDFTKGVDLSLLPLPVVNGIYNHRVIDKYTDNHPCVRALKLLLTTKRRRFSAVISDVVFDHFLVRHWDKFSELSFNEFSQHSYQQLSLVLDIMPERMRFTVDKMISQDWLSSYQDIDHTGKAIDSISKRIRFENNLAGAIEEVKLHYEQYESAFLEFFPQLQIYMLTNGKE
ncbi:acyl carrier protein phosphodiesterase [Thalassotalea fonticola]|uniref:Acyl carrier protein phosphodiesterase n=1 Tax=Thalassotalea fonticola TaxID=3065649 RepID=A0ABZ0GV09_9GAMM|nr:acyl carrier protein phosphodiesterase [Colwelliaceae bacterium S1-1]